MDFKMDFDAPMYRDFTNFDPDEYDNSDAEAYFEVDHEARNALTSQSIEENIVLQEPVPNSSALKENLQSAPKTVAMGAPGLARPAGLRDVTNSPLVGAARARTPLKRASAVTSPDEPRAKQTRGGSEPPPPARQERRTPEGRDASPAPAPGGRSRLPTPRGRGRSVDVAPTRASPRLAARRAPTPDHQERPTARVSGRRRSVSAAPPLPPRRHTPGGARRRTPAASPAPASARRTPSTAAPATRRAPSTGGRRRSLSQNDAARAGPSKLVISETPNVLRRGLQLRSAARAAAEQAVKQEQQSRLDSLRRQMADYKKKAAEAKQQPVRARPAAVKPPTRPQPFHLHEGAAGGARPAAEFRSTAQMIEGFHRKTPPRFHSRPAGERAAAGAEAASPHVTVGRSPALLTRARTRSATHVPSREEQEQAEIEEARQHQIRARPVNRRVLEHTVGVPAKQARPATAVEPFQLTQPAPRAAPAADETSDGAAAEFRAAPAPRALLAAPQGVPARPPPAVTKPQSPALQLRQRMAERRKQVQEQQQSGGVLRANPIPDIGVPFKPIIQHRSTQPEPFSFETRDRERQAQKERKIKQVLEEERRQREFRAQLLPPSSPRGVPERRAAAATRPQPFQLPGDQQAAAAAAKRQKKLEEEAAAQRAAAEFHAQPCTVTRRGPYQPARSGRGPTEPRAPQLHTDQRSARRQSFEERQKQREAELQAAQEEADRLRLREEEEQVARQRREAVHLAQPVRRYRPVHVAPSDAPLTQPRSPNWASNGSRASHRSQ